MEWLEQYPEAEAAAASGGGGGSGSAVWVHLAAAAAMLSRNLLDGSWQPDMMMKGRRSRGAGWRGRREGGICQERSGPHWPLLWDLRPPSVALIHGRNGTESKSWQLII